MKELITSICFYSNCLYFWGGYRWAGDHEVRDRGIFTGEVA